jgi:hypothetical protein
VKGAAVTSPVIVDEKAQENGMAVMMADLITQNMEQHPEKVRYFNKLKAVVAITAVDAEVKLTMFFNRGSCMVYDGIVGKTDLHIVADSETLLNLSSVELAAGLPNFFAESGRVMFKKMCSGELKIHGMFLHPLALIRLTNIFSIN